MGTIRSVLLTSIVVATVACASTAPPQELLLARSAFNQASVGPAAQQAPAELENARQALAAAEKSFANEPDAPATRDLAYVAHRRVLIANAKGQIATESKEIAMAEESFKRTATSALDRSSTALAQERDRFKSQTVTLESERSARIDAEKRARDAMDRLSALAAVKEEPRGTVITLSGSVLFPTNKSDLLPSALERLNQVADAVKEQPDREITVFGHTDAQGADDYNVRLSERRAQSVREYLVSRGVDSAKIRAVGKGKAEPIADNKSAEGRANNRRVEIVLARVEPR
jgi:outer membrane protein OmpA-like peptidoglycan-associated protein